MSGRRPCPRMIDCMPPLLPSGKENAAFRPRSGESAFALAGKQALCGSFCPDHTGLPSSCHEEETKTGHAAAKERKERLPAPCDGLKSRISPPQEELILNFVAGKTIFLSEQGQPASTKNSPFAGKRRGNIHLFASVPPTLLLYPSNYGAITGTVPVAPCLQGPSCPGPAGGNGAPRGPGGSCPAGHHCHDNRGSS